MSEKKNEVRAFGCDLFGTVISYRSVLDDICLESIKLPYNVVAKKSAKEVFEKFELFFKNGCPPQEYIQYIFDRFCQNGKHILQIFKEIPPIIDDCINSGIKVYALSNTIPPIENYAQKVSEHLGFIYPFLSSRTGDKKPHKDAFLNFAKAVNESPENILIADNNIHNVKIAKALGFQTEHFKNPSNFRFQLSKYLS